MERLTDLSRRPRDSNVAGVHAVHDELTATTNIVDRVFQDLLATGSFHDDIKAVWVVGLESVELSLGLFARQLNVLVSGTELLSQVHFQTLRGNDNDIATTVLTEHLGQNQTSGTGTEDQHRGAHLGSNLV